jgi:hypothetical protein
MGDEMQYTARSGIKAPDTAVFGYRRGDDVPPSVVEAWGLTVGDEVSEGPLPVDDEVRPSGPPTEADTRATWESWAVANGMDADKAAVAPMDELQAVGANPADDRPADSAKKSEWVDWVVARGADESWARDGATTKADLQNWTAGEEATAGDTVASSPAEANQG